MKKKIRITVVLLAAVMAFTGIESGLTMSVFASKESELQQQIDALEKEQKKLTNKINQLANDTKKQKDYQKALDQQINSVEKQIDVLETQIAQCNIKISAKEKEIAQKNADIDQNYDKMLERLAAMQLAGENSMLVALFSAGDFTDFLTRAEMLQAIAEQDRQLIDRLSGEKRDIEAAKQEIVNSKNTLQTSEKTLANKKTSLQSSIAKSESYMQAISAEKADYEKRKAEVDKQEAALEAELKKFYQSNPSTGTLSAGGWLFPLAARNYYISSPYGPRWGTMHKGVDLSCSGGSHGKSIVAAKDGIVIRAVSTYTPGVGYGKNIIIDHGGNYSTLYAHCSQILVSYGQRVKQGDVIAKVGNTGNSFGAHLHFEVRVNGVHQNPMKYIKL